MKMVIHRTRNYGGSNTEIGYDVVQTSDGGFMIVGQSMSFGTGHQEFYLLRTDADGNFIWQKHIGHSDADDLAFSVKETIDGSFAILGSSTWTAQNKALVDFILMKTNSDGDTLWTRRYSSNTKCEYFDFDFGCNSGYIITGALTDSTSVYSNVCLIKTDDEGNVEWSKTFGGQWDDACRSVKLVDDGYVVTGYSDVSGGGVVGYDVYAIKVSCNGEASGLFDLNQQQNTYNIFPNPLTSYTIIQFKSREQFHFSLFNFLGNQVMDVKEVSDQLRIEKGRLPAGAYFYVIDYGNQQRNVGKLVIQ